MTIKDLIRNKDYDYVSYRLTVPSNSEYDDIFAGCFRSENGEIHSLDGDSYNELEEVLFYEEWTSPEDNVKNGLTIVCKGEWIIG